MFLCKYFDKYIVKNVPVQVYSYIVKHTLLEQVYSQASPTCTCTVILWPFQYCHMPDPEIHKMNWKLKRARGVFNLLTINHVDFNIIMTVYYIVQGDVVLKYKANTFSLTGYWLIVT